MDTLLSLKVFCQVVENGSFTKASEALGISTAMASKHVSHLEKSVNARLLNRTSRSLSLTNEGEIYHAQCMQALALLDKAKSDISTTAQTPQGHLRIAVPTWCASPTFAKWIAEYQERYPKVSVDLVLDNAMTDLASGSYDLALRVQNTLAQSLIVRPVMTVAFVLVASPEYLNKHGTPATPSELQQHDFVLPSYIDISQFDFHDKKGGGNEVIRLSTRSQSNNTVMLKELVLAGSGIGYLPMWLVQEELQNGSLVRLFGSASKSEFTNELTLHAVYLSRRHQSAKVRSFIDFMVSLASDSW